MFATTRGIVKRELDDAEMAIGYYHNMLGGKSAQAHVAMLLTRAMVKRDVLQDLHKKIVREEKAELEREWEDYLADMEWYRRDERDERDDNETYGVCGV
jgi:hypothetical protein